MNSLDTKRNSHGRVARDRGPRRAQVRARRGCRVTGPGQQSIIILSPGYNGAEKVQTNMNLLDIKRNSHRWVARDRARPALNYNEFALGLTGGEVRGRYSKRFYKYALSIPSLIHIDPPHYLWDNSLSLFTHLKLP